MKHNDRAYLGTRDDIILFQHRFDRLAYSAVTDHKEAHRSPPNIRQDPSWCTRVLHRRCHPGFGSSCGHLLRFRQESRYHPCTHANAESVTPKAGIVCRSRLQMCDPCSDVRPVSDYSLRNLHDVHLTRVVYYSGRWTKGVMDHFRHHYKIYKSGRSRSGPGAPWSTARYRPNILLTSNVVMSHSLVCGKLHVEHFQHSSLGPHSPMYS